MSSKNAEQTALAADDAYEHAVDPDDGDVVEVEASKNLTPWCQSVSALRTSR